MFTVTCDSFDDYLNSGLRMSKFVCVPDWNKQQTAYLSNPYPANVENMVIS